MYKYPVNIKDFSNKPDKDDNNKNNILNQGVNNQIFVNPYQNAAPKAQADVPRQLINYNEKFKGSSDILFRDKEISQLLMVLISKNKPNVIIVGQNGVGKTKLVEHLAKKLEEDSDIIPDSLKGYTIYELSLTSLVSGSKFVGQLEENIEETLDFLRDPENKAIAFIDEIHMLANEHNETYNKIAQILKPALARGEIKVIGATTIQEANNLASDPAFKRRFSQISANEFTKEQTKEILKNVSKDIVKHYNNFIQVDDDTNDLVIAYSEKYKSKQSHRPDTAITLLDRSIATMIINHHRTLENATDKEKQILKQIPFLKLNEAIIERTAKALLTNNESEINRNNDDLEKNLRSVIKGQDHVIDLMLNINKKEKLALFEKEKPTSILFSGPSGVGKTEIVKIYTKTVFNEKPIILNLTEFTNESDMNKILGVNSGYVGCESKKELPFDQMLSNPYQVILLDEFEKAHPSIQRLFMQALDEGYLEDNRGQILDFKRCIIFATTNAANKKVKPKVGFGDNQRSNKEVDQDLAQFFDVELLNRFQNRINFNTISLDVFKEIIVSTYEKEVKEIKERNPKIQIKDKITDKELEELAKNYNEVFGARPVKALVRNLIESYFI